MHLKKFAQCLIYSRYSVNIMLLLMGWVIKGKLTMFRMLSLLCRWAIKGSKKERTGEIRRGKIDIEGTKTKGRK